MELYLVVSQLSWSRVSYRLRLYKRSGLKQRKENEEKSCHNPPKSICLQLPERTEMLKNVSLGQDGLTGKVAFAKSEDFELNPRDPHGGRREILHVVL